MTPDQVFVLVITVGIVVLLAWMNLRNRRDQPSNSEGPTSSAVSENGPETTPGVGGEDSRHKKAPRSSKER